MQDEHPASSAFYIRLYLNISFDKLSLFGIFSHSTPTSNHTASLFIPIIFQALILDIIQTSSVTFAQMIAIYVVIAHLKHYNRYLQANIAMCGLFVESNENPYQKRIDEKIRANILYRHGRYSRIYETNSLLIEWFYVTHIALSMYRRSYMLEVVV